MGHFFSDILEQHPVVSGFCCILQLIRLLMRMMGVVTFSFVTEFKTSKFVLFGEHY